MVWRTCSTCKGEKVVIRKGRATKCSACKGKGGAGRIPEPSEGGAVMVWRTCQNCHGNQTIEKEGPPGKWRTITCPACKGKGGEDTKTV
jgi:DnaJ-class molecular chaperone